MIRVLHISTAKTWRGGEQQVAYFISGSSTQGVKNILYCPRHSALQAYALTQNIPVHTFFRLNLNPFAAFYLTRLVKKYDIALLHIHDAHAHNLVLIAYTLFGLKTKAVLHRRVDFPLQTHFLSSYKYNHPNLKKIICVSEFVQNMVARRIRDTQKLCTIYSGIETRIKPLPPPAVSLHRLFNIPHHYKIIANIAALAPHKDYFTWVNTVHLLKNIPHLHFVIFGEPNHEWREIKKYIALKGLETHISFAGFRDDLDQYMSEIDILLVSSNEEGLNTSIMDAFVHGIPVVATTAGGIPELITHQRTGWLGKVGDASSLSQGVQYVLAHPEDVQSWVQNAKSFVESKDYMEMTKQTIAVYASVLRAK